MSVQPWETLSDESLVHYKVFDVREVHRRSPRTGEDIGFFLVNTLDWVVVVALTEASELVMIRQFRQGSASLTLEVPGGVLNRGEDPRAAALRELREESGYVAGDVVRIGDVNPNPALFTNRCTVFLATDCVRDGELQMDPGEDIEVVLVPSDEVDDRIRRGEVDHSLVISALHFYKIFLGE